MANARKLTLHYWEGEIRIVDECGNLQIFTYLAEAETENGARAEIVKAHKECNGIKRAQNLKVYNLKKLYTEEMVFLVSEARECPSTVTTIKE